MKYTNILKEALKILKSHPFLVIFGLFNALLPAGTSFLLVIFKRTSPWQFLKIPFFEEVSSANPFWAVLFFIVILLFLYLAIISRISLILYADNKGGRQTHLKFISRSYEYFGPVLALTLIGLILSSAFYLLSDLPLMTAYQNFNLTFSKIVLFVLLLVVLYLALIISLYLIYLAILISVSRKRGIIYSLSAAIKFIFKFWFEIIVLATILILIYFFLALVLMIVFGILSLLLLLAALFYKFGLAIGFWFFSVLWIILNILCFVLVVGYFSVFETLTWGIFFNKFSTSKF